MNARKRRRVTSRHATSKDKDVESYLIRLPAPEQLQFWNALHAPIRLTKAQEQLGRIMRGGK
jgi:hypothetical protein